MAIDPTAIITSSMLIWLIPLIIWEMIWKGIALWKSGRNNQLAWFVFILILNTAGILPIIYLIFFQKKRKK
jgi:methionyl-tRNA synthetase